jgi:hypothetical protein
LAHGDGIEVADEDLGSFTAGDIHAVSDIHAQVNRIERIYAQLGEKTVVSNSLVVV